MLENFAKIPYILYAFSLSGVFLAKKLENQSKIIKTFYAHENSFFLHIFLSRPVFMRIFPIGNLINKGTSDRVKRLSFVVPPTSILRFSLIALRISSDPRSQQGVVVQIWDEKGIISSTVKSSSENLGNYQPRLHVLWCTLTTSISYTPFCASLSAEFEWYLQISFDSFNSNCELTQIHSYIFKVDTYALSRSFTWMWCFPIGFLMNMV